MVAQVKASEMMKVLSEYPDRQVYVSPVFTKIEKDFTIIPSEEYFCDDDGYVDLLLSGCSDKIRNCLIIDSI